MIYKLLLILNIIEIAFAKIRPHISQFDRKKLKKTNKIEFKASKIYDKFI